MANAYRDQNSVPTLIGVSNVDGFTPVRVYADPVTHRLLVDSAITALQLETPTGSVDGSNVTFTVSNTPKLIATERGLGIQGNDFSYDGAGTVTMNLAPVQWIRSFY